MSLLYIVLVVLVVIILVVIFEKLVALPAPWNQIFRLVVALAVVLWLLGANGYIPLR